MNLTFYRNAMTHLKTEFYFSQLRNSSSRLSDLTNGTGCSKLAFPLMITCVGYIDINPFTCSL